MDDDEFWNESKIASFSFDEDDKVSRVSFLPGSLVKLYFFLDYCVKNCVQAKMAELIEKRTQIS